MNVRERGCAPLLFFLDMHTNKGKVMAKSTDIKKDVTPKKLDLEAMRLKAREKVTGIFRFFEVPGGVLRFSYLEFKGDKVEKYEMYDGETYSVPLGVARHLNKNGWYPTYDYVKTEQPLRAGNIDEGITMRVAKKIRRFGFQSLQFMDIDDLPAAVSEVLVAEKV